MFEKLSEDLLDLHVATSDVGPALLGNVVGGCCCCSSCCCGGGGIKSGSS